MPYQEILARAWRIFKRQRALWLFGILTACSGGVYGKLNLSSFRIQMPNFQDFEPSANGQPPLPPEMERFFRQIEHISPETWLLFFLGILFLVLLWMVVIILLRSFVEPALIRGILEAIENDQPLSVREIARQGKPFFGRMLLFHLLVGGSGFILMMVIVGAFGVVLISTLGIGLLCLLPLMLLFVPLAWLIELYLVLATMALVIEDLDVITALQRGWQMLKQHFWSAVIMGILLTFIHVIVSFLLALLVMAIVIPLVAFLLFTTSTSDYITMLLVAGAFAVFVAIILSLVVMGLLQTYLESAWVLTYRHFLGYPLDPEAAALPVSVSEDPEEAEEGEAPEEPETSEEENPPQASEPPLNAAET